MKNSKFKEYFLLNLEMVKKELLYMVLAGMGLGILARLSNGVYAQEYELKVAVLAILCIPLFKTLCSETLYQQKAYLYQSFPVSEFEVVFAKVVIPAVGMLLCMIGYGIINIKELWLLPIGILVAVGISNAAFWGITISNMYKSSRAKKPNTIMSVFLTYFTLVCDIWLIRTIVFNVIIPDNMELIILGAVLIIEIGIYFYINVKNLKRYYQV